MRTSPSSAHRAGRLLMALGAAGALAAAAGLVVAGRASGPAPARAAGHALATPPPAHAAAAADVLSLRPRLAEGAVLARLTAPGGHLLTIVEGLDTGWGEAGHDTRTGYPGEPHAVVVVAGPGVDLPPPAAGTDLVVTTGYGTYRYRVSGSRVVAAGSPLGPDGALLRLLLPRAGGGQTLVEAALVPADPETAAMVTEELAVARAEDAPRLAGIPAAAPGHLLAPCWGPISQRFGPVDAAFEFPFVYQGVWYPHFHTGLDIAVPSGTAVRAAAAGVVVLATTNLGADGRPAGYGTYVLVAHGGGLYTLYAHLSALAVSPGESVAAGQVLGLSGSTGNSTGPHLHFEVREGTQPVDPLPLLQG